MLYVKDAEGPSNPADGTRLFSPLKCNVQRWTEEAKLAYRDWARTLRATTDKQTIGQLRYRDSYCCLGILAKKHGRLHEYGAIGYCGESNKSIQDMGLRQIFLFDEGDYQARFMTYNDSWKLTFSQIADCIDWGCEYGWLP